MHIHSAMSCTLQICLLEKTSFSVCVGVLFPVSVSTAWARQLSGCPLHGRDSCQVVHCMGETVVSVSTAWARQLSGCPLHGEMVVRGDVQSWLCF